MYLKRILFVSAILLVLGGNVTAKICKYASEDYECSLNPSTWGNCIIGGLIDIGNCALMLFINTLTTFILMNPDINIFKPFARDIITLLFPMYATAIVVTGIYIIFLSTAPESRAKAKLMLVRLIMGMAMVTTSMEIYEVLLNLAHAIAGKLLAGWIIGGGSGGISFFTILIAASILFFYISIWIVPLLALLTLISIAFRYILVCLMAVLFPITLFLYFFEFTRGIGSNLMRYTMMAIFTQPLQALMLVITIIGLQNVGAGGGLGESLIALIIGIAGFCLITFAPLIMLGIMNWVGGAVAGAGMMIAFKRPTFGLALVSAGGIASGMGPEALMAGGSAWMLGRSYTRHAAHHAGAPAPPPKKHRVTDWVKKKGKESAGLIKGKGKAGASLVKRKGEEGVAWMKTKGQAGSAVGGTIEKVGGGVKWAGRGVKGVGSSIAELGKGAKAAWADKAFRGKFLFIPGYWLYSSTTKSTGLSVRSAIINRRYNKAIDDVKNSAMKQDRTGIEKAVGRVGGREAVDELKGGLRKKYEKGYGYHQADINEVRDEAMKIIRRDKAIRHDIGSARNFNDIKKLGVISEDELGRLKFKDIIRGDKNLKEIANETREKFEGQLRREIRGKNKGITEGELESRVQRGMRDRHKEIDEKIMKNINKHEQCKEIYEKIGHGIDSGSTGIDRLKNDLKNSLKTERATGRIDLARNPNEVKAIMRDMGILGEELESARMSFLRKYEKDRGLKPAPISKKDVKKQLQDMQTLKQSASKAVEDRKDLLERKRGTMEKVKRGIQLAGLSIVPFAGPLVTAKVIIRGAKPFVSEVKRAGSSVAEAGKPVVGGIKRAGSGFRNWLEKGPRGKRMVEKWDLVAKKAKAAGVGAKERAVRTWDASTRRTGAALGGAGVDLRERIEMGKLKRDLVNTLRKSNPHMSKQDANDMADLLVGKYKGTDRNYSFSRLENELTRQNLTIDQATRNELRNKYDPARIKGRVKGSLSKKTGQTLKGAADKMELKKKSTWLLDHAEEIAKHTAIAFILPGYPLYILVRRGGLSIGKAMAIGGAMKTILEAGKKVKEKAEETRAGRAVGETWAKTEERIVKFEDKIKKSRPARALGRVKAGAGASLSTMGRWAATPKEKFILKSALVKDFGVSDSMAKHLSDMYGRGNDFSHIEGYLKTRGVGNTEINNLRDRMREPLLRKAGGRVEAVGRGIGARLGAAGEWTRERTIKKIDMRGLRKDLSKEFEQLGETGVDANRNAKGLVDKYSKDGDFKSIELSLKNRYKGRGESQAVINDRIREFTRKYGPEAIKKPLIKRAGAKIPATAIRKAWVYKKATAVAKHVGLSLAIPVYPYYMIGRTIYRDLKTMGGIKTMGAPGVHRGTGRKPGRDVYVGMKRAKADISGKEMNRIEYNDSEKYRRVENSLVRLGVPRGMARLFIDEDAYLLKLNDNPRNFKILKNRAAAFAEAEGFRNKKFTEDLLKPLKPSSTIGGAVKRAGKYVAARGAITGDVLERVYNEQIGRGKNPAGAMEAVNNYVNDRIIESGGFSSHLKETGIKYKISDDRIDTADKKFMNGRRESKQDIIDGKKEFADKKIERFNEELHKDIYDKMDKHRRIYDEPRMKADAQKRANELVNNYTKDLDFTKIENELRNIGVSEERIDYFRGEYGSGRAKELLGGSEPTPSESARINARHLRMAHNEMAGEVNRVDAHDVALRGHGPEGHEPGGHGHEAREKTPEEWNATKFAFGLDLGSNMHARMLLEDYMGIGPRPSEFYHGIGPESKEEREKRGEEEEKSLYEQMTVGTETLGDIIYEGLDELRRLPTSPKQKKLFGEITYEGLDETKG